MVFSELAGGVGVESVAVQCVVDVSGQERVTIEGRIASSSGGDMMLVKKGQLGCASEFRVCAVWEALGAVVLLACVGKLPLQKRVLERGVCCVV